MLLVRFALGWETLRVRWKSRPVFIADRWCRTNRLIVKNDEIIQWLWSVSGVFVTANLNKLWPNGQLRVHLFTRRTCWWCQVHLGLFWSILIKIINGFVCERYSYGEFHWMPLNATECHWTLPNECCYWGLLKANQWQPLNGPLSWIDMLIQTLWKRISIYQKLMPFEYTLSSESFWLENFESLVEPL